MQRSGKILVLFSVVGVLTALWAFTPLAQYTDVATLKLQLQRFRESPFAVVYVTLVFIAGGFVLFPVTVLMAATVFLWQMPFGPIYALTGILSSASVSYLIGKKISDGRLRRFIARHTVLFSRRLQNGVLSVAIVRHIPVAPFTVVNMVIGASEISYTAFFVGTLLGLFPSVMALALLERQLAHAISNPGWESALFVLLFLIFVGCMMLLFRRLSHDTA